MGRIFKVTMRQLMEAFGSGDVYPLSDDRKNTLELTGCDPVSDDGLETETVPVTTDDIASTISRQISLGGKNGMAIRQ